MKEEEEEEERVRRENVLIRTVEHVSKRLGCFERKSRQLLPYLHPSFSQLLKPEP